ncbi:MAG TPA: hypothetical protein VMU51_35310 [Mycobacteriales bacterium]|nr:hypothetical protein [Mycobacteriales bacterium]
MGHTLSLELQTVWKILVVGLILGAGLPTVFAAGIRAMAYGQGGEAEEHAAGAAAAAPHLVGRAIGILCFAIVLAAVVLALIYIVATGMGKVLSFEHIYPTITSKK